MRLKSTGLMIVIMILSGCSIQRSDSRDPIVGTGHEYSFNKKYSIPTFITLPFQGIIISSASEVSVEIESNFVTIGYPTLACKGQQHRISSQKVISINLKCKDGTFGTAFVDLDHDKNDLGNGQFSLSNGTVGIFDFGHKLLLNSQL